MDNFRLVNNLTKISKTQGKFITAVTVSKPYDILSSANNDPNKQNVFSMRYCMEIDGENRSLNSLIFGANPSQPFAKLSKRIKYRRLSNRMKFRRIAKRIKQRTERRRLISIRICTHTQRDRNVRI